MPSPLLLSLGIAPHTQQQKFIDADEIEQLYGGAKRGGKSVALCQKMVLLSVLFPGNRILLARADMTDLKDTTLKTFWQVCPPELIAKHHMGDREIFIKTGTKHMSTIIYRGLGDIHDVEKSKGIDLGALAVDEPSEVAFEAWMMLRSQLNWKLPNGMRPPYMSMLASNPEPGWVKERYIDPGVVAGRIFIPSLPRQNPGLPPGWEDDLRANYPAEWVEKYLNGSWDISEGMVFTEWDDIINTVEEDQLTSAYLQSLRLTESIDVANTGVTAYTIAGTDPWENTITLAEHYQKDKLVTHHASEMLSIRYEWERRCRRKIEYTLIDPSALNRTMQSGNAMQAMADLYREAGIDTIPAWNALEMGIERLKQYIHVVPHHTHPLTGAQGAPHFYVVKGRCPNLIKEIKGLKKEYTPGGTVKFVGPDHALDTVRYRANSQPRPGFLQHTDRGKMTPLEEKMAKGFGKWSAQFGNNGNGQTWFGRENR